ncbi:DUF4232 domain-containing protein [Streptomyces sp. NPDC052101]|uniref:DUF4232 domain-containing protein n=1 Tax=Streptomyces sp. NPDC052101 TaxID=3155763 RepID=UPI00341D8378
MTRRTRRAWRTAAVSAIGLTVVLAAAGCGGGGDHGAAQPATGPSRATAPPTTTEPSRTPASPSGSSDPSASSGAPRATACRTEQLHWKLTRLAGRSATSPTARLTATNTSAAPCTFNGYPDVQAYAGKGPAVWSEPKAKAPVRMVLNHDMTADFPLFYPASPAADGSCAIPVDDDPRIQVRPPHPAPTDYGTSLQITDSHGRHVPSVFCDTIRLGAPKLR